MGELYTRQVQIDSDEGGFAAGWMRTVNPGYFTINRFAHRVSPEQ